MRVISPPPPPLMPRSPMAPPPPGYQEYRAAWGGAYGSFGARFGGLVIDWLISVLFVLPAAVVLLGGPQRTEVCTVNQQVGLCDVPTPATQGLAVVLAIAGASLFIALWSRKVGTTGQSWGMKATGVKVVDAFTGQTIGTGRAVGRYFARIISGFFFGLGYLWMLWDERKQTWHDKIVSTVVIRA